MINKLKYFFAPAKHASDKNTQAKRRSQLMLFLALLMMSLIVAILVFVARYSREKPHVQAQTKEIAWDSAFGKNFTDKDNQSALKAQQIALDDSDSNALLWWLFYIQIFSIFLKNGSPKK